MFFLCYSDVQYVFKVFLLFKVYVLIMCLMFIVMRATTLNFDTKVSQ